MANPSAAWRKKIVNVGVMYRRVVRIDLSIFRFGTVLLDISCIYDFAFCGFVFFIYKHWSKYMHFV